MADEGQDKKHDPGERQLRDAGERGELPRSPELTAVATTMALAAALTIGARTMLAPILGLTRTVLAADPAPLDVSSATGLLHHVALTVGSVAVLPLGTAAVAALIVGLAQTRFQVATKAFEAKLDHLDPFATFQRLFLSRQPLVELVKGLLHVGALGAITGYTVAGHLHTLPRLAAVGPGAQLRLMGELGADLVIRAIPVMGLLAAVDYGWSYWSWWQNLRRTDQQLKDDHKEQEGDPYFKMRRRRRMRELATRQSVRKIAEVDVLVTNPTHVAVGLRYRHGEDAAPVVVVKGVDHLALKLRQEAFRLQIPRVEDRALARTLYAQVQPGHPVPATLYGPVAKVLAVVYRRRKRVPVARVERDG